MSYYDYLKTFIMSFRKKHLEKRFTTIYLEHNIHVSRKRYKKRF